MGSKAADRYHSALSETTIKSISMTVFPKDAIFIVNNSLVQIIRQQSGVKIFETVDRAETIHSVI